MNAKDYTPKFWAGTMRDLAVVMGKIHQLALRWPDMYIHFCLGLDRTSLLFQPHDQAQAEEIMSFLGAVAVKAADSENMDWGQLTGELATGVIVKGYGFPLEEEVTA